MIGRSCLRTGVLVFLGMAAVACASPAPRPPQPAPPRPPPAMALAAPGAPLPAGWQWPAQAASAAFSLASAALASPGILRPVDAAQLAALQGTGPCAPAEVAPGVWITPLCGDQQASLQESPSVPLRPAGLLPAGGLPPQVDLRMMYLDGPVKNQQATGVCWAFAVSTLMDNALRRAQRSEVIAPLHVVSAKLLDEVWKKSRSDQGMTVEGAWPYDPVKACKLERGPDSCERAYHVQAGSWRADPMLVVERERANQTGQFRISKAQRISPSATDQMMHALAGGQAVYIGMDISSRAWSTRSHVAGVIPDYMPDKGSGHAVALVGYRTTAAGVQFLIHNSWGTSWGDRGYAWISEAMIRQRTHSSYVFEVDAGSQPSPTSGPLAGLPFPLPIPGGVPLQIPGLGASLPMPGAPATGSSGCAADQGRDLVFGTCAPACAGGAPRVAGLCAGR